MRARRERGSVTVVTAASVLVILVCTMGVADVGRVLLDRSRSERGADAAALAAAQELANPGTSSPAEQAAAFATANGSVLVSCRCEPGSLEAVVTVSRQVDGLLLFPGPVQVRAQARAVIDAG